MNTLQPAFVLHTRAYRDTSLLVELLTKHNGRLTVVARGVRSTRSKFFGLLEPFSPLLVSFRGKSELQTLQQAEPDGLRYNLQGNTLISGFYLNELLINLLGRHDPHPNIFQVYRQTLSDLSSCSKPDIPLRLFEKSLLIDLGYGLQLDRTINDEQVLPDKEYMFEFGVGLKAAKGKGAENFLGSSLLALHSGVFNTLEELKEAKRLLRSALVVLLGAKSLKSRELFFR